ncbi:MAG: N-acetylmuramoyl-L-alanine amidase [Oscillospiraceae bacterium]|nr:N-acetylmuramoyl-L-alanine amidase [Oscillospiraceae bacterium]
MKKLISILFALILVFAFGITANAEEKMPRLFIVVPDETTNAEEIITFASENGFNGILLDLRKSASADIYSDFSSFAIEGFSVYVLADESVLNEIPKEAKAVFEAGLSDEAVSSLCEKFGAKNLSLFLPFGKEYNGESKFFSSVFTEVLLSSHSEYGYEDYVLEVSEKFSGKSITTVNDLSRVLVPVSRGDFFGDAFELNNQYLINKIHRIGFCINDYRAIRKDAFGSASFLLDYFGSAVLDEYADFSVSQKLAVTRPTGSSLTVSTEKYTIFGTSDPTKPLYMNGEELERISSTGLFAATVNVPKKGATYTFSQGGKSVSVTLKRSGGSSDGGYSTTTKLSSISPSGSAIIRPGKTEITLSCVGPSGGYVTAKIGDKTFVLEQVAYAEPGVPAKFTSKAELSGEYPAASVTDLGKVTYYLTYKGKNTNYESAGSIYYIAEDAALAVMANCEMAGVEKEPKDNGDYLTTLRTGCSDYVEEITENGWYHLKSGGYIKASQCNLISDITDITNRISSAAREVGENYEKLILQCSNLPAFKGSINGKTFTITLSNTEWSDFSSTDMESELMYRINPVDNGDGTVTIHFFSKTALWGWDVFTDTENKTFSIVLKGTPTLSDDVAKPLSGITVAVCAGHGGPDPGALSVAGEKGVNEAQINLANALTITESLENLGAKVVLLITEDKKLDTYGRTDPARYAYSDVYVCCHANSVAENAAANLWCGTYVYYHYDHSAEFSKKLCDYISASTKRDNEGAIQDYYSVTRLTMCPAVMLEVGFVSNPKELESLIDPVDIQKTAHAVTKAIIEILDN